MWRRVVLVVALVGCEAGPRSTVADAGRATARLRAGASTPLGRCEGVAAADLDGDGVDSVVCVGDGRASWDGHSVPVRGNLNAVARGDVDGDGKEEVLLALGTGRDHRDAPAQVVALDDAGATTLWERAGERAQITDLAVLDGKLWLVTFRDRWVVEGGWIDGGAFTPVAEAHMGMRMRPWGDGVAVGRLYGEVPRSDGDLAVHRAAGRGPLPSLRGVRTLATADLDGDGRDELLVGDGWHAEYGKHADPRVVIHTGDGAPPRSAGRLSVGYTAREIEVVGSGADAWLLVTGTRAVHALQRDALGWAETVLAPVAETRNAVLVHTASGLAVAVAGPEATLVALEPGP